ncbi:hypothetical protein D3C87_1625930 [compost metagenome]
MAMPVGKPMTMEMTVQTKIIDNVFIVSLHMSRYPIAIRVNTQPRTIFQLRLANQAIKATSTMMIGQGVVVMNLSDWLRKTCNGWKKASKLSP